MHSKKDTIAKNFILPRKGTLAALAWFFGSAAIVISFLVPNSAEAATLYSQTNGGTTMHLGYGDNNYHIGTGIFGTPSSVIVYSPVTDYASGEIAVTFECYQESSYTNKCGDATTTMVSAVSSYNGGNTYTVDFSSNTKSFDPSKYYLFDLASTNYFANSHDFYGNGTLPYVIVSGSSSGGGIASRIISISPTVGSSTATTTTLSATFYNNSASDSYQFVNFHLVNSSCDATIQSCPYSPIDVNLPITFDGQGTLNTPVQLANGLYIGYVSLQPLASTGLPVQSVMSFTAGIDPARSLITFNTAQGTSTATTTDLTQGCSTSVLGVPIGAIACFLFVPDVTTVAQIAQLSTVAATKSPFVYAYQIGAIRNAVFTASSTASTSLTVALWHLPNTSTTTISLISESQIAAIPFAGTIYNILTFLIWLSMAEYIYYRVLRMHDTHTPS